MRRAAEAQTGGGGPDGAVAGEDGSAFEETARLLEVDVGDLYAASEILDGEEFETSPDPDVRSTYRRILTMNTAQKAILAMKGGREERMILIRDTNKIVSQSVLRNGRLTEQEVEQIARMRNVSDEILRLVGFRIEDWRFAVRLSQVQTSIMPCHVTRVHHTPSFVSGIISIRGTIVCVLDLGELLANI